MAKAKREPVQRSAGATTAPKPAKPSKPVKPPMPGKPVKAAKEAPASSPSAPDSKQSRSGGDSISSLPVIYPHISVNGVAIPEAALKITPDQAKQLLGWETEADYYNRLRETDPRVERSACEFGTNFLLVDEEGNKVRCDSNKHNRPLTESWCRALAQDILNRHWRLNLETIIVSRTGQVDSGQHRLIALILASQIWKGKNHSYWLQKWSEEPYILSLVACGGSDDQAIISTLDNVKPRSLADVFFTSDRFSDKRADQKRLGCLMLDSAVKFLWKRTSSSHSESSEKYATTAASIEFLDRHLHLLDHVKYILDINEERAISKLALRPGECAGMLYLMASSESDPDTYLAEDPKSEKCLDWENEADAKRFWKEVVDDTALLKPLRMALSSLVDPETGEDGRKEEKICVLAKAWDCFVNHRPLSLEEIRPEYRQDAEGRYHMIHPQPFGGIDFGDPRHKDIEDEDSTPMDKMTLEERKEIERTRRREEMRERILADRKRREEASSMKSSDPTHTASADLDVIEDMEMEDAEIEDDFPE